MNFDEETISQVWERATVVAGYDAASVRKDACGAWIVRGKYGNRDSHYGWEIDHVLPRALGGGDDAANLRAMQWENNVSKGDSYPSYRAVASARGTENVSVDTEFTVNEKLRRRLRELYKR